MAKMYRVILTDKLDWHYIKYNRSWVKAEVKKIIPNAKLVSDVPNTLIFDIGYTLPDKLLYPRILCDSIYYQYNEDTDRFGYGCIKEMFL